MEEKKKLYPGDEGYQGGITHSTVRINGINYDTRVERDEDGNPVTVSTTKKIWGIF